MGRPNKRTGGPCGVIVIDKPPGMTSMAAVAAVRRRAGGTRTGHAGTLDPLATGVLVVALGPATRALSWFMAAEKRYRTAIDLSAFTETDDMEGPRLEVDVAAPPAEAEVREALRGFVGRIMQRPPARSAVKLGGVRAYKLSRRGLRVEPAPRPVDVFAIDLVGYQWPIVELDVHCGKGTYIRSLARDLGAALGTGGHCRALRRLAIGPFTVDEARRLQELPQVIGPGDVIAIEDALARLAGKRAQG
jgi:tRNA pseudouridine55 synthase